MLGGGNKIDCSLDLVYNFFMLCIEVVVVIFSMYDEIDIYWILNKYMILVKVMVEVEQDFCFIVWWKKLCSISGILDYFCVVIIVLIKFVLEDFWIDFVVLCEYINCELVECDYVNFDQKMVEIVCCFKFCINFEKKENDEIELIVLGEIELLVVCSGKVV